MMSNLMVSNVARLIATSVIWIALPFIVEATQGSVDGGGMIPLVAIIMITAAGSTHSIWTAGARGALDVSDEKAKRTGSARVRRMIDTLSDEELDELRARLSASETPVPLETLLARREHEPQ